MSGDELAACCASRRWVAVVAAGLPYPDTDALLTAGLAAYDALDWADVAEAVDAHPRIGERAAGDGREARWSRAEQHGAATVDDEVRAALHSGNLAYEQRFGRVFLICATGLSATEMLAALRDRLGNTEDEERAVVRAELRKIVTLRLRKLAAAA